MSGETPRLIPDDLSESVVNYIGFMNFELAEMAGAYRFAILHAAPPDMSSEQLEALAGAYREAGWIADVAAVDPAAESSPLGVRIRSEQ